MTVKTLIILPNNYISNKYYYLEMIIIRNLSPNQHIRIISEGSCDSEDLSNDAENSALLHINKLHLKQIQIEYSHFKFE